MGWGKDMTWVSLGCRGFGNGYTVINSPKHYRDQSLWMLIRFCSHYCDQRRKLKGGGICVGSWIKRIQSTGAGNSQQWAGACSQLSGPVIRELGVKTDAWTVVVPSQSGPEVSSG